MLNLKTKKKWGYIAPIISGKIFLLRKNRLKYRRRKNKPKKNGWLVSVLMKKLTEKNARQKI